MTATVIEARQQGCPQCGTRLSDEPWATGLCVACLARLGLEQGSSASESNLGAEAHTLLRSTALLHPGEVEGERYRIRSRLGGGGMGEVWRAFDLKLRVDVALKALHSRLLSSERAREMLRQEVRTAREVLSPNVCRVFDLVELDSPELGRRELISMEYVDGVTLAELLEQRSPLELDEARDIAAQLLAGLEAIHAAGLVHRDVKPENVMLTRAGRVVLMDFGIARTLRDDPERRAGPTVAGTPAYMSPEQARGDPLDPRADVFAAGIVLAEMIDPRSVRDGEARQHLWQECHRDPPLLADTPWAPILRLAVAAEKQRRPASAAALARALEEVTARITEHEIDPYPGLASFTEQDAENFFGRELEVEAMWKKLRRLHLLGLIGPSGTGKTSFLRAGVLPAKPFGWGILFATPGVRPFTALAEALAQELASSPDHDAEQLRELIGFEDPDRAVAAVRHWRDRHQHALVVVDQFEELFTQSSADVQHRFAELLGRLTLEADVRVLLSLRDDFLHYCGQQPALTPIFEALTLLGPLAGSSLRRAIVQPALRHGYRFEDEALVDEILAEVEGERGALPLLAFAAAELWRRRDRERGLLTREAYREIGGVGGALARHAEATLEEIGHDRLPIVRELFRHLVTAQQTRATWDRDELLSAFEEREAAAEVLAALIDARLLTTYELESDDRSDPHHRIEIIHESLLRSWPRLVRWQSQDEDSAHLRDQLRQVAQLWEERGRPDDLLWTGTSYQDYELWRERYPGGLSAQEEAFAAAMTRHAERRKRRRRMALTAAFATLLTVLVVVGGFWRRSEIESRRAESANLFTQAQATLKLADHPSGALSYAIAALEHHDTPEIRRLIVEALWRGPTELRIPYDSWWGVDFGPEGRWLAASSFQGGAALWPSDGGPPTMLEDNVESTEIQISPRGDVVANTLMNSRQSIGLWSLPEGRFLRSFDLGEQTATWWFEFSPDGERVTTITENFVQGVGEITVRSWPVAGGEPELIARIDTNPNVKGVSHGLDASGRWLSWSDGYRVMVGPVDGTDFDRSRIRTLLHDEKVRGQDFDADGRWMAVFTEGAVRVWSLEDDPPELRRTLRSEGLSRPDAASFSPSGTLLASAGFLWDLGGPPGAEPLRFRRPGGGFFMTSFHPSRSWVATSARGSVSLWPLTRQYPVVLPRAGGPAAFTRDGRALLLRTGDELSIWPLRAEDGSVRVLHQTDIFYGGVNRLRPAPDGSFALTTSMRGHVRIHPLDGGPERELEGFTDVMTALAVGPRSRLVAAGSGPFLPEEAVVRVWDLETGEVEILDAGDGQAIRWIRFLRDGDVLVDSSAVLRRWDLSGPAPEVEETLTLSPSEGGGAIVLALSDDETRLLILDPSDLSLWLHDLTSGVRRELATHRGAGSALFADAKGGIVISTDPEGAIRVGRIDDEEPHLLIASEPSSLLDVSPDGGWIAATAGDDVYLWPMPDLDEAPIHTLPRTELLARLRALVNLEAVPDPESVSGWTLEIGPFPGWEEVPIW